MRGSLEGAKKYVGSYAPRAATTFENTFFAENYFSAAGGRVFSVTANGTAEITNLDVFAAAGAKFKAIQRSFTVNANASGQIALAFSASADQPKVGPT